jgi:hypothetical protein
MANNGHAKAQGKALRRLVEAHRPEYQEYYREECAKAGLRNYPTKAERLAKIREQLRKLEESAGV